MIKTETNKAIETITKCLFSQLLGGALEMEQLNIEFAAGYDKELQSIFIGVVIVAPNGKPVGALQFYNKKEKLTISTYCCEGGEFVPVPITKNTINNLITFAHMVSIFILETPNMEELEEIETIEEGDKNLTIRLLSKKAQIDVGFYINKDGIEEITIN